MRYANVHPRLDLMVAGWAGVVAFVLTLPTIALYFVHPAAPPVGNVLARMVLNGVVCCALLIFMTTLSASVARSGHHSGWLAAPLCGTGIAFVVVTLVADAIQSGAVLKAGTSIDPTLIGSGGEAAMVVYSPLARLLTATFLLLCAAVTFTTDMLPRPLGVAALGVAVFHLALVPSVFSTTDPSRFYSLNGWSIPVAGGLLMIWVLATSVALLSSRSARSTLGIA